MKLGKDNSEEKEIKEPKKAKPKQKGIKKVIRIIITVILSIILAFSLLLIGLNLKKYYTGNKNIEKLQDIYNLPEAPQGTQVEPEELIDPTVGISERFLELYKINPDIVGWLKIDGTKLDLPVVKGQDNAFYLDHTMEKESHPFGVPFAHYGATITREAQSENISIFGHSARNGSYFAPVKEYKDLEFYKKHTIISFDTIYSVGNYKVIGLFMEDVSQGNSKMFAYHDAVDLDEAGFNDYIYNVMKRSYFTTDVDIEYGDKLITLSTCDYEVNNVDFRVALVARKVRPGESVDVNTSLAKKNTNQLMPDRWYTKKGIKNPFAN